MVNYREEKELLNQFSSEIGRMITKIDPIVKSWYPQDLHFINLLMTLQIRVKFDEFDYEQIEKSLVEKHGISPQDSSPKDYKVGGYITRDTEKGNPDRMVVHIILSKENTQTWQEYFIEALDPYDKTILNEVAFTYLHEAMHLLMRHYDWYMGLTYEKVITGINPDLNHNDTHELLNHGYDYWINSFLINKSVSGSFPKKMGSRKHIPILYDYQLSAVGSGHPTQAIAASKTQQEIIEILAKDAKKTTTEMPFGKIVTLEMNGRKSTTIIINVPAPGSNGEGEGSGKAMDKAAQSLEEAMGSAREQLLDKTKGTGSQEFLENLGVSYEVPTDWFKHLESSMMSIVRHHTSKSEPTWAKLKTKFRRIGPFPGRTFYEKSFAVIISIDQSGSMSNDDLRRINNVAEKLADRAKFMEILLHDTEIGASQRFVKKNPKIGEFITNRVSCGGTSHSRVFERVHELKLEFPKTKFIYMSFSDNWSDIEQVWDQQTFDKVESYWITTDESRTVKVPGMQISLENGVLQM